MSTTPIQQGFALQLDHERLRNARQIAAFRFAGTSVFLLLLSGFRFTQPTWVRPFGWLPVWWLVVAATLIDFTRLSGNLEGRMV